MERPLLAEQPNIEVDAIQRAQSSDGVGGVLENMRRPNRIRWLKKLRQRSLLDIVVELPIVQAATCERFLTPSLRYFQPRLQAIDSIHRTWIIDGVGRDQ